MSEELKALRKELDEKIPKLRELMEAKKSNFRKDPEY